jgi:hypothetical protein
MIPASARWIASPNPMAVTQRLGMGALNNSFGDINPMTWT